MTSSERKAYFGHLWPAACLANEWFTKDDDQRRSVTAECMRLVRGPQAGSTSDLGPAEITALFTYLIHLGHTADLDKSARWVTCQEDYRTFHKAKQADWFQEQLYGEGQNKLTRNRFDGEKTAAGGPLDTLDPKKVQQRLVTMGKRYTAKKKAEKLSASGGLASTGQPKGAHHAPEPEKPATTNAPRTSPDGAGEVPAVAGFEGVPMPASTPHKPGEPRPFYEAAKAAGASGDKDLPF